MDKLTFVSIFAILTSVFCLGATENSKKNDNSTDDEEEEWHDPCQSIWWRKIYRPKEKHKFPAYQDFENFVDCLRDYDGIYINDMNFKTLGHGRDVPRGWWTRYRAHTHKQKYPFKLNTYEEFEEHVDYLSEAYTVFVTRFNFNTFWDEHDVPVSWWAKYDSTHKSPFDPVIYDDIEPEDEAKIKDNKDDL